MAIRTYCDICEQQIMQNEMSGIVKYVERDWGMSIKKGVEHSLKESTFLLCERCVREIKNQLAKMQAEINKKTVDEMKK